MEKANYEAWLEQLLEMDTPQGVQETIKEIEIAILESPSANDREFRLRAFWLLRHLAKLV